jgi:hypothetical protein
MYKLGKIKTTRRQIFDAITISGIIIGIIALVSLLFYYTIPMKFADIKVPVATDKSSYYPSQEVGGIFFGEIFYNGEVRILREVFCANYHGIITPPDNATVDGNFLGWQSKARKLNGTTIDIGVLPEDVPVGANCVIQFTNVYNIQTPFGIRKEEYQYYTQNFSITTKEKRNAIESEAAQKNAETNSSDGGGTDETTNNTTTNNTTNISSPPVNVEEKCSIDILFVKFGCEKEAD